MINNKVMEENILLKRSVDQNDIVDVMKVVSSFGANEEGLSWIRNFVAKELNELGYNRVLYLLYKNNEPLASVQLVLKNETVDTSLYDGKEVAHIHSLQVAKPFQRKGFGQRLINFLESDAKSNGFKKLTLAVESDNIKAISLYNKIDYKFLRQKVRADSEVSVIYMLKNLEQL